MSQWLREGGQKMTGKKNSGYSKKVYFGKDINFERKCEFLGHGGNGGVYEINIININASYPVVAKFFECNKNKEERKKRYYRFKKEIMIIQEYQAEITGMIKILDYKCPDELPKVNDESWYVMPRALPYRINSSNSLIKKLNDMLQLATTINLLHIRKLAHRDIKPENILMLDDKIILSDFGLVWATSEERVTDEGDRIGPYKILPPELEDIMLIKDIDYYPSDVYLFAKVLWMVITENNAGFRGKYNRGDRQIYLDRKKYSVKTIEPLHRLLEKATEDKMNNRIKIDECIKYINTQINICSHNLSDDEEAKLLYSELSEEFVNIEIPSERVYTNCKIIYKYLNNIFEYASISVSSVSYMDRELNVNKFIILSNDFALMLYYAQNGRKVKEYLFKAKKLTYKNSMEMIIETAVIEDFDSEYTTYADSQVGFAFIGKKIVLNEEVIIEVCCKIK